MHGDPEREQARTKLEQAMLLDLDLSRDEADLDGWRKKLARFGEMRLEGRGNSDLVYGLTVGSLARRLVQDH